MAAVLPESMDRLNVDDPRSSLSIIEEYIRYMGERIEFSMRNMTKTISAAGVSTTEVYILITAMSNSLSALDSTVNGLTGTITGLKSSLTDTKETVQKTEDTLSSTQTAVEKIENTLAQMQGQISDLQKRVENLESTQSEV